MSFQSILPKEGWKSQKVVYFAKGLCRYCLSKKIFTPALPHARISTFAITSPLSQQNKGAVTRAYSTLTESVASSTVPLYERLQDFHNELYHPTTTTTTATTTPITTTNTTTTTSTNSSSSTKATTTAAAQERTEQQSDVVRKTIARRLGRKRLIDLYRQLTPLELKQLTREDVDIMVARFCTNPDDPTSARAAFEGLEILQDVKAGKLPGCTFLVKDCEQMVQFAVELKLVEKAERWAKYIETHFHQSPSSTTLERLVSLLAEQKKQERLNYWLTKYTPTRDMLKSNVLCMLSKGQMDQAAQFLKTTCELHSIDPQLNQMVTRYTENHELMENVLDAFGMDAIKNWKLNEAREIYNQKQYYGLGTRTILKSLVSKCIYTGQIHTLDHLLKDAIRMSDTSGAQFCAQGLLRWYMKKKNNKHAFIVWELLDKRNITLPKDIFTGLILQYSKSKYHIDTMRLYRRFKELYPVTLEMRVRVLRCLVRSKQYQLARTMCDDLPAQLKHMEPSLAKLTSRTIYSLCAQTGDTQLYEDVFRASEALHYSTTHEALTSLIACYLKANNVSAAKAAFQSVATHTNGPDVVDFNLLMRTIALEEVTINHDKILDILKHMKVVGVSTDQSTLRTMLNFYPPKSPMRDELYTKLLQFPNASTSDHIFLNNIALTNLLKLKPVNHVVYILTKNDRGLLFPSESGKHIVRNSLTYQILIDAACKDPKNVHLTMQLHKDMCARGFKPSHSVYERIIHVMAMSGRIKKAREVIQDMESRAGIKSNVITWTKIVDGLLAMNKPELAKDIITHDMAIRNITLDAIARERLNKIDSLLSEK